MNKIIFLGSKYFGFNILKILAKLEFEIIVLHPDDKKDPSSNLLQFKKISQQNNFKLHILKNNNKLKYYLQLYKPEIVFVCGFYKIIEKSILKIPKNGFWGIHNSFLPEYRGGAPLVWQMINIEKNVGSTLFKFDQKLDAGDIIYQFKIKIHKKDHILDIINKLITRWSKILKIQIDKIYKKKYKLIIQKKINCKIFPQRYPSDGLINFKLSYNQIDYFIRAQSSPYPGAYIVLNKKRYIIYKYKSSLKKNIYKPGTFVRMTNNFLSISTGSNIINIFSFKRNNKIYKPIKILKNIKF